MSITCIITYDIDPAKKDQFIDYAKRWAEAIPRCGADLIGYYAPHEGCTSTAYGIYNIEDLAAYEQYRARLSEDADGKINYSFAQREQFIRRETRLFVQKIPC
ncbi:MAG: NIPSNAP family protein [Granulosicoccus sp.]|nr:NIPSNAP family protein [Granulosicoccus sp.]